MPVVHVKFPMSEEIWNKVMVECQGNGEHPFSMDENSSFFTVEYDNEAKWNKALNRFEGMVEYEILSTDLES